VSELAHIETVVFLQSAELFAYCKAEEILRIAAISHERRFAAGEKIYEVNDPAKALYCVVQGEVTLDNPSGETRRVGPLGAFGANEILSGRLRRRAATTAAETLTLEIDAEDFLDLLCHNIEIVKALFRRFLKD
jgi:CRP-like cAMP-binding protein